MSTSPSPQLPAPATLDCDPGDLYRAVTDAEADGDFVAATWLRYLAADAIQLQAARDHGTGAALEQARSAAAIRVLGRLGGLTATVLDAARAQATLRVRLELRGVPRDHVVDTIDRNLIRDGYGDDPESVDAKISAEATLTVLDQLWQDVVMETAAWAGRYAAPTTPPLAA